MVIIFIVEGIVIKGLLKCFCVNKNFKVEDCILYLIEIVFEVDFLNLNIFDMKYLRVKVVRCNRVMGRISCVF